MVENQFEARRAILVGDVGDIRHQRNAAVLRNNSLNPNVAIEFYSSQNGIVAGLNEVKSLLDKVLPDTGCEIWALDEGEDIKKNEDRLELYSLLALKNKGRWSYLAVFNLKSHLHLFPPAFAAKSIKKVFYTQ